VIVTGTTGGTVVVVVLEGPLGEDFPPHAAQRTHTTPEKRTARTGNLTFN
jgi:hypothetical protein